MFGTYFKTHLLTRNTRRTTDSANAASLNAKSVDPSVEPFSSGHRRKGKERAEDEDTRAPKRHRKIDERASTEGAIEAAYSALPAATMPSDPEESTSSIQPSMDPLPLAMSPTKRA